MAVKEFFTRAVAVDYGAFVLKIDATGSAFNANRSLFIDVNNTDRTLKLVGDVSFGGAFTTSGANALTLTTTGATNITFPAVTDTAVTVAAAQTLTNKVVQTVASSSSGAGLRVTPGSAPSAPANGDLWTTTTALQLQVNGATKNVAFTDGMFAYTSATTPPLSPNSGDKWLNTTTGVEYTYVSDGNSSQWIDLSSNITVKNSGFPVYIGSSQPTDTGSYMWIQTGIGPNGTGVTMYLNA